MHRVMDEGMDGGSMNEWMGEWKNGWIDRQEDKSEANKSLYIFLTLFVCVQLGNICLFFSVTLK